MDLARLKKLTLMLSSAQPGEVVNAASAIERMLREDGKDWHWLAGQFSKDASPPTTPTYRPQPYRGGFQQPSPPPPPPRPPRPERLPITPEGRAAVARLKDHLHKMDKKDQDFVESVLYQIDKFGGVTQKQCNWIDHLFAQYPK
jgi:hypothetical protein